MSRVSRSNRSWLGGACVVLAVMVSVSCGGNPKSGQAGSTAASAKLTVTPASLSFGSVNLGSSSSQSGQLTAGTSAVTVSSAQWTGEGFSLTGISFPVTIPAGKSLPYTVLFTPEAAGNISGTVGFVSNAANSPGKQTLAGTGTTVVAAQHSVTLDWVPSTSPVAGYNVYRGTASGGPYARLNGSLQSGTTYLDGTVQPGVTYYYVATAVDASAQESSYSDEAAALVP